MSAPSLVTLKNLQLTTGNTQYSDSKSQPQENHRFQGIKMCLTRFGFQLVFCLTLQIDVCDEDLLIVLKYCCKSCIFFPSLSTPNASHFHMRGGMAEAAVNKSDLLFFHPKCITLLSVCTFVKYLYIFPVGFLYLRRISAP